MSKICCEIIGSIKELNRYLSRDDIYIRSIDPIKGVSGEDLVALRYCYIVKLEDLED